MTRRIRLMMAWLMVLSLTVGSGAFSAMAQEGTPVAPPSSANQLFAVDGIDAPIVASAPVADPSSIDGALLLERLELPAGVSQAPRATASAELYYVESGALSIQDDFGFGTTIAAGNALPLNAGTTVTLANQGAEPAVVLRLRLSDGAPAASEGAGGEATPVDLTATTTQGADEIAPTVLVQMPVSGLSLESAQLFLSRATFSPGSATGEQGHAGPIGIYVESGALNVVSPSGFQGTIGAGQGVSLPAETPLQASTVDAEAVVLIVGLGAADAPFGEVTPESVAATEEAAGTAATETPQPTEAVTGTGSSTILQLGETWEVDGATMTVSLDDSNEYGVGLTFAYTNLSSARVDFLPSTGALRVYDDQRNGWKPNESNLTELLSNRIILEPGETIAFLVWIDQPNGYQDYSANTFVVIEGFGVIGYAKWGFTYNNGRVLTIPPDAVDPTANGQEDNSQTQTANQQPVDESEVAITDIHGTVASLSPPDGLAVKEQGSLGADQITATFSDPVAASRFFNDWGWQENAFVYFEPPNGGSSADGIVYVDVGLHRFASADGASQALTYFADTRRDQMRLGDVEIAPIGEQSRALIGPTDMGTEASVYARVGTVAIRVSVMSVGTDPLAVAIGIAQGMVAYPQSEAEVVETVDSCDVLDLPPYTGSNATQITTSDVNFRAGPGVDCELIGEPIPAGSTVEVLSNPVHRQDDDTYSTWVAVAFDGSQGWLASELLAPQAGAAPSQQSAPVDLMTLLPGAGDVPALLVVTGERNRTLAEVAENYVNPADTTSLFTGWGWQGNVTRAWQLPSGASAAPTQVNGVYVSIHIFDNPQGAAAALDYSLTDQSALTGAWEVASPGLGDYSRALWGQETYGNEITLLVQRGTVLIRVSAAQLEGDPTPAAAGIVQGIINRAG